MSATPAPIVDVVIAVHTPARPIERAVGSVLDRTGADRTGANHAGVSRTGANRTEAPVRVTVVVHNTDPEPIEARLREYADDPRLRIEAHSDGIPSPAGPMNRGFDLAEARYVSLLGSDDEFEPGAIDAWLAAAEADGSGVVIAPLRRASGSTVPTPPVRKGRRDRLEFAADRLIYRSAPLGLIARSTLGGLRFPEGIPTGEDQPFVAALWSTRDGISFPAEGPGYLIHDDQLDRVTTARRPISEEFRVLDQLLADGSAWLVAREDRLAVIAKTLRVHVLDAFRTRCGTPAWDDTASRELAEVVERLLEVEPRARRVLSRVEAELLDGLRIPGFDTAKLTDLDRERQYLSSPRALITPSLFDAWNPQAPLKLRLAGSALARGGRR